MRRDITARKPAEPGVDSEQDAALNARLTDHIRANAIRVDQTLPPSRDERSAAAILAAPLLSGLGIVVFGLASAVSYVCGYWERRGSTRVWDGLGLPVVASDMRKGDDDDGADR